MQFWLAINKLFSKYQKNSGVSFFSSKNPTVTRYIPKTDKPETITVNTWNTTFGELLAK